MFTRIAILLCLFASSAALATVADKNDRKSALSAVTPTTAISHANRNYPGGRDEEDLKVQENLVAPTVKIDRRMIESKVLKTSSKKVNSDEPEATEQ